MRIRVVLPCVLAVLGVLPAAASAAERPVVPVANEVIVRFEPGVSSADRSQVRREHHAQLEDVLAIPRVQVLSVGRDISAERASASLERDPRIEYAEPNLRVYTRSNDPFFGSLWGLENFGGGGGIADADIDAPDAWAADAAATPVRVAVVDTGVALGHPDLAGRLVPGHDFVDDDDVPADIDFDASHGTHVAGTIGAVRDNSIGVAGVAEQVEIMPLRVLGYDGSGAVSDVADAFAQAGAAGVPIVNASLGVTAQAAQVETLRLAIAGAPGTLFVVAAGNGGSDGIGDNNDAGAPVGEYPCRFDLDNVLCVAASNSRDQRASFSNWGAQSVDIAAPGFDTWSTTATFPRQAQELFEGPDLSSWTQQSVAGASTWTLSGASGHWSQGAKGLAISPNGGYENAADTVIERNANFDLTGREGCQLLFDLRMDVDDNASDSFRIEAAVDPLGTWTTVFSRSADTEDDPDTLQPAFVTVGADLEEAAGLYDFDGEQVYLRLRFTTDGAPGTYSTSEGVFVDFLELYCTTPGYGSLDGTSMAAPHVAGAAALVLGNEPSLATLEVKQRLLSTGDASSCWTGLTTTGRRLNVARALGLSVPQGPLPGACPPPVDSSSTDTGGDSDAPPPAPAPPTGTDSGGTSTPTPLDSTPPVVTASAARRYRSATLLGRGLRARLACDEGCRLRADVLIGRRTAKRLGITGPRFGRSYIRIGRSRATLSSASSKIVITRISRGAHRGLRRARSVRLVLRVLASDEHGNDRVTRRTLTVRR